MAPPESVIIEHSGTVATVSLNRPDALNAFDRELAMRLDAALRTVEDDDSVRAVILTGVGRAFSAGQDVRELQKETSERGPAAVGAQLRERFNPLVVRLRTMEKPVIAAINGVATGAGLGLALAADYRVAGQSASLGIAPLGIGFIPGVGASILLPAIVGLGRASELALLGERVDAARALAIGLVTQVVPDDELSATAMAVAERFAALPTRAIGLTKRAFNHASLPGLVDHLAYEAGLQEIAAGTSDHREGLSAVLEKRQPSFTGQ
jgi:2-(1,2-epoxy-1,2-dihydrophenyl)acetyl-CoA isomerase